MFRSGNARRPSTLQKNALRRILRWIAYRSLNLGSVAQMKKFLTIFICGASMMASAECYTWTIVNQTCDPIVITYSGFVAWTGNLYFGGGGTVVIQGQSSTQVSACWSYLGIPFYGFYGGGSLYLGGNSYPNTTATIYLGVACNGGIGGPILPIIRGATNNIFGARHIVGTWAQITNHSGQVVGHHFYKIIRLKNR